MRDNAGTAVIASYQDVNYVFFSPDVEDGSVPSLYAHNGWAAGLESDDIYTVLKPGDGAWATPERKDPASILEPCTS